MQITFTEGYYNIRGNPVNVGGLTFRLVEDYKVGKDGEGYVTVDGTSQEGFPERNIRIKCRQGAYSTTGMPSKENMLLALKAEPKIKDGKIGRASCRERVSFLV